jgi:hypothetical protein
VAVFGLSVWNLHVRDQRDVAAAQAAQLRQLVEVVHDPATRHASLTSESGVHGSAYLAGDQVWLVVAGLAPNDVRSSVYVLWRRDTGGRLYGVATFDVTSDDGPFVQRMRLAVPAADVTGVAISKERGRRMPAAPSGAIASGDLQA